MPLVKLDKAYPHAKLDRVVRRKKSEHRVINEESSTNGNTVTTPLTSY